MPTVAVIGASPDASNPNLDLRQLLADGFSDVLGSVVQCLSLETAPTVLPSIDPDLAVVFGSCFPEECDYRLLRTSTKAHMAFWLTEDPYEFDCHVKVIPFADTIFTTDRSIVARYTADRVFHLPLGASARCHYRPLIAPANKQRDVFFCGVAFPNRVDIITSLSQLAAKYALTVRGTGWPSALASCDNRRIQRSEMPDWYSSSRLVLNLGRQFDLANVNRYPPVSPGPRTFEAAMAGAPQLYIDQSDDISRYFEPGREIAVAATAKEAVDIIDDLLAKPNVLQSLAEASQARALSEHAYTCRARTLLTLCDMAYEAPPGHEAQVVTQTLGESE